ncbi:hypothetical protein ABZR86_05020 [Dyella marensis]|uniref:hypothetical protein n=1 Tax=Dyella TaxID=231454 RepID=UPI001160E1DB|nr:MULTISPECIES: hypothetical protein [Dyella]
MTYPYFENTSGVEAGDFLQRWNDAPIKTTSNQKFLSDDSIFPNNPNDTAADLIDILVTPCIRQPAARTKKA